MKLLKAELEQIIKEEIEKVLKEYRAQPVDGGDGGGSGSDPDAALRKKIEDDKSYIELNLGSKESRAAVKKRIETNKAKLEDLTKQARANPFGPAASDAELADIRKGAEVSPFTNYGQDYAKAIARDVKDLSPARKKRSKNARQIALSRKTGISIKKMQKDLFDKGFAPQGVSEKDFVDGRPGQMTRQAIEDLQDDLQVKADGLYGQDTHKAWKKQDFAYARRKSFADKGVVDRDVATAAKKKAAVAQSAGGNIARLKKAVQNAKINFRTMRSPQGGTPVNDPRYKRAKLQYQKAQALLRKALGQQKLARLKAAQSAKLAQRPSR